MNRRPAKGRQSLAAAGNAAPAAVGGATSRTAAPCVPEGWTGGLAAAGMAGASCTADNRCERCLTMSRSGILDALRNEEPSRRSPASLLPALTVENAWEVRRLLRLPYRGFVPVTPPTVGLKAGPTREVAAPPAVMSLVTPTPACTGETDRERRPTCTIVDREAGLHGIAIRAGRRRRCRCRCRRRPVRVCRQRRCTTMG